MSEGDLASSNFKFKKMDIKEILIQCREYVAYAYHEAEARHDNDESEYYMDGATYEYMEEALALMKEIDEYLEKIKTEVKND